MGTTKECYVLFWTNPECSIIQNSSCTATYLPSNKLAYQTNKECLVSPGKYGRIHVLQWTPTHGHTNVDRAEKIFTHQLCADTWCSQEDQPEAMDDWDGWREGRGDQGNPFYQHDLMILNTNNLLPIIRFQVFFSNTNNLQIVAMCRVPNLHR